MSQGTRVFGEGDYDRSPDPGVTDDLWVYLATDEGTTGIAYTETAGGATVNLIAPSEARAELLRPFAQHVADITGYTLTLVRFRKRETITTIQPRSPE